MNKTFLTLGIAIFFYSCSEKKPFVLIKNNIIYLDTLQVDSVKKTQFYIHNKGQSTLIIEGMKTSCECTVIKPISNTKVIANDSILIPIEIKGYKNDIGKQKEVICTIRTNAPSIFDNLKICYWTR